MSSIYLSRLGSQRLAGSPLSDPTSVVSWFGAMQAQDYAGAKWSIGLRARGVDDAAVERAFDTGGILRTHVMRPTWHFVAPADIRWLLRLTAPRVHVANGFPYRTFELDRQTLAKSRRLLERALVGASRTRLELADALEKAGIVARGPRLAYILMHAELEGVVCSGPRRGRQFTYALLEERVPSAPVPIDDEALAALAERYIASHGPVTVRDFSWWSGLTIREARRSFEILAPRLVARAADGLTYWSFRSDSSRRPRARRAYLLPTYDEFGIAYKDRVVVPALPKPPRVRIDNESTNLLLLNGTLVGRWRRLIGSRGIDLEIQAFRKLPRADRVDIERAAAAYARFQRGRVGVTFRECV